MCLFSRISNQNNHRKETELKEKITCDFCDKLQAIQIITLLGEIQYLVMEPPTQSSHSISVIVQLIATLGYIAILIQMNYSWNMHTFCPALDMLLCGGRYMDIYLAAVKNIQSSKHVF